MENMNKKFLSLFIIFNIVIVPEVQALNNIDILALLDNGLIADVGAGIGVLALLDNCYN